jgi:hypothetical protein
LKPFSKLFREFSHPRVFGSTTRFPKTLMLIIKSLMQGCRVGVKGVIFIDDIKSTCGGKSSTVDI